MYVTAFSLCSPNRFDFILLDTSCFGILVRGQVSFGSILLSYFENSEERKAAYGWRMAYQEVRPGPAKTSLQLDESTYVSNCEQCWFTVDMCMLMS